MFDLTGKIALVAGAASGIGEATAVALAKAGACIYVADLDEVNGERVAAEMRSDGGQPIFLRLNVAENHECESAAETVSENHGALDVLVNNAGIGHVGTIEQATTEDLDRVWGQRARNVCFDQSVYSADD